MTGRIEKTVFISYRRSHFPWAYCIYQNLTQHGFDVFFDYQSIDSGNFERVILDNIRASAHFIVVLAPSALERCNEPGDWLRREIETAMDERRNIIPVMLESFDFGSPLVTQYLTGKLESLRDCNGLRLIAEYMEAGFEKLRNRFLNKALEDIHLHPLTEQAKEITEIQKAAASKGPPIEKRELTAQVWLERGYVYASNGDFDEALRCLTESINSKPSYEAFYNRAIVRRQRGDLFFAIHDYNMATALNPGEAETYNNRGNAHRDIGDLDKALWDYNKALTLKEDAARVYINRGVLRCAQRDMDGAIEDFNKALKSSPSLEERAEAYYRRGRILQFRGELKDASKDYERALQLDPHHLLVWASIADVSQELERDTEAEIQWQIGRKLVAQEPDEYNRACFESIFGNTGQAWSYLIVALSRKQITKEWARIDPDLENIRADPAFKVLVGE